MLDLTPSLCAQARKRGVRMGGTNVEVVEGDATTYQLPKGMKADLVRTAAGRALT